MDSVKQFFIQSPKSQSQTKTLTLTLDQANHTTLSDLKSLLFPSFPQLSSLFFSFNGKTLENSSLLSKIPSLSTLTPQFKLLGGGGDGGSTCAESRDCYLNMYASKKPDKVDPNEQRLSKWTTCALSFEPLKPPCVIDRLGNVFNKETLVKSMLGKTLPKAFRHIKGLKDMISIHLCVVPSSESQFQCPITGLELNGKYKFLVLRKCGHVLSVKALKEVKSSGCLVCHREFEEEDKIVINGTEEEVEVLRNRMEEEKVAAIKLKDKKSKKVKAGVQASVNDQEENLSVDCSSRLSGKRHGVDDVDAVGKTSAKLVTNGKVGNKVDSDPPVKRFKAVDVAPAHANKKVYASIFTSSRKSDFKETYSCRSLPLGRN